MAFSILCITQYKTIQKQKHKTGFVFKQNAARGCSC